MYVRRTAIPELAAACWRQRPQVSELAAVRSPFGRRIGMSTHRFQRN